MSDAKGSAAMPQYHSSSDHASVPESEHFDERLSEARTLALKLAQSRQDSKVVSPRLGPDRAAFERRAQEATRLFLGTVQGERVAAPTAGPEKHGPLFEAAPATRGVEVDQPDQTALGTLHYR